MYTLQAFGNSYEDDDDDEEEERGGSISCKL